MQGQKSKYFMRNWWSIFFGAIGAQTMYVLLTNYSLIFFTDFLGVGAGVAGTIFAFSRAWDAINDPMCGAIIDKSNSRFGKSKPFVVGGGLITAVGLILFFTVPKLSLLGKTIWGTVSYNVIGMAFTAVTVSILVQMPRASASAAERGKFSAAYTVGVSITGILLATIVTKGLAFFGKNSPARGYQVVAILSAVIGLVFLMGNAFLSKDQVALEEKAKDKEKGPKVGEMLRAILHTPPFLIAVAGVFVVSLGAGISSSSLIYHVTYVLKDPGLVQILLPLMYIGILVGSILAGALTKFKKITLCKAAMVIIAAGCLMRILTGDSNIIITCIGLFLFNAGTGLLTTAQIPILMDCADYTEAKEGVKCQALTMTGYTLCSKMAMGIGTAILGFALQIGGYVGTAAVQSQSATTMIYNMHLYAGLIVAIFGFVIFSFYRLENKNA